MISKSNLNRLQIIASTFGVTVDELVDCLITTYLNVIPEGHLTKLEETYNCLAAENTVEVEIIKGEA